MSDLTPEQVDALLEHSGPGSRVHLVGVGGCGMSGLAHLLLDCGHAVSGTDLLVNEEIRQLAARGACIWAGHDGARVAEEHPMLLVHTSAVRGDHPEIVAARATGIPVARRATALAALARRQRSVCVAGMHGKTTTTALVAFVLERLGARPSYAIGALTPQLRPHARFTISHRGPAPWFVMETDESDGTLRQFFPEHVLLLNLDAEHLDYYRGMEHICAEFEAFAEQASGLRIYCKDDSHLDRMLSGRSRTISFGVHPGADYRVEEGRLKTKDEGLKTGEGRSVFTLYHKGVRLVQLGTHLHGLQNFTNIAAAFALLHQAGFPVDGIVAAIAEFTGAERRQQLLRRQGGIAVYDDYGHHPSEIRATLQAFQALNPQRLLVAFQPHRFTRTQQLAEEFAGCFGDATMLWLAEIYPASEPPIPGVTSKALAETMRARGQAVQYVPSVDALGDQVLAAAEPGDILLFLGAGDITRAAHAVAERLKTKDERRKTKDGGDDLGRELTSLLSSGAVLRRDEPMSRRTTWRVGGRADFYAEPASVEELAAVVRCCRARGVPMTIVGGGANLLVGDDGIRGVVVRLGRPCFKQVRVEDDCVRAGAGEGLRALVMEARDHNLAGFEFLEGVPGSVGGALRMNAGAMGSWIFDVLERVRWMDVEGNTHECVAGEISAGYRDCSFFENRIGLEVVVRGHAGDRKAIEERMEALRCRRKSSQPMQPSAGCVFKNPQGTSAGRLIDEMGFKGKKIGGAMVSDVHANFIVNTGGASARDICRLIHLIRETAREQRGITLELEIRLLGIEPEEVEGGRWKVEDGVLI